MALSIPQGLIVSCATFWIRTANYLSKTAMVLAMLFAIV
jgi:hypothetical protein